MIPEIRQSVDNSQPYPTALGYAENQHAVRHISATNRQFNLFPRWTAPKSRNTRTKIPRDRQPEVMFSTNAWRSMEASISLAGNGRSTGGPSMADDPKVTLPDPKTTTRPKSEPRKEQRKSERSEEPKPFTFSDWASI